MFISFLYLLLALIPVLIYIGVIWSTTQIGSINIKSCYYHFISGVISIGVIFTYFKIFPNCQSLLPFDWKVSIFIFSFIQVALVEEFTKLFAQKMGELLRGEGVTVYDSPIATMFYCGISALGFSFIENVTYALKFGGEVLIVRSFVAMLLHFLCGLIMGYWIAASRIPTRIRNKSPFEFYVTENKKFKTVVYYILGIFSAVFIHGLYDFNIFTQGHVTSNYLIIFSGVIAAYLAAKDLNEKSKMLN